jgi:hypothetical protein
MSVAKIVFIGSAIWILVWGIIGISCYYGGYIPNTHRNLSLRPTQANIAAHYTKTATCYEDCNPHQVCSGSGSGYSCHTVYDTCPYTCYDHYLTFKYNPDCTLVTNCGTQSYDVYMYRNDWSNWSDSRYIIGTNITAYYNICPYGPILQTDQAVCANQTSMDTFRLTLYASDSLLNMSIATAVFVGLGGFAIIVCLAALLVMYLDWSSCSGGFSGSRGSRGSYGDSSYSSSPSNCFEWFDRKIGKCCC